MTLPKLPPFEKVRPDEAEAMLSGPGWIRDERLSRALMAQIWRHDDGRALARFVDGAWRSYRRHAELAEWYGEADRQARRGSRWEDVIPQGASFPDQVPDLIRALPKALELAWTPSGDDLPDLDAVEGAVRRLGQQRVLEPDVLPAVVAYVGELIRRQVGGEWTAQDSGQGFEPDLMVRGRHCGLMRIYKEILEDDRDVSLRAFVEHHLRVHGA